LRRSFHARKGCGYAICRRRACACGFDYAGRRRADGDVSLLSGFGDFPGTASLSLDTARNLTIDAVLTGLCTLAVRRIEGAWRIEASRYTIDVSRDPCPRC
jgi:hypothetical protein